MDADDFGALYMYEMLMREANRTHADAAYCSFQNIGEDTFYHSIQFKQSDELAVFHSLADKNRMEIMASHEYGNVCGGYRYRIIEENELYLPEYWAYGDNFWIYALQMMMGTVSVANQSFDCYR